MDVFLVKLFSEETWCMNLLFNAKCYKADLERRKPGFVFAFEAALQGKGAIAILEQERKENNASVCTSKFITVFIGGLDNLTECIKSSLEDAMKDVMRVDVPLVINEVSFNVSYCFQF